MMNGWLMEDLESSTLGQGKGSPLYRRLSSRNYHSRYTTLETQIPNMSQTMKYVIKNNRISVRYLANRFLKAKVFLNARK
mmetsp:Transcript_9860/g.12810  ORF Transcript_9860/g.12810 Transcript_9860/m.12810 type:complete len:80 (-) Transcript_9860:1377-1616(-)